MDIFESQDAHIICINTIKQPLRSITIFASGFQSQAYCARDAERAKVPSTVGFVRDAFRTVARHLHYRERGKKWTSLCPSYSILFNSQ